jgi:hypothetical protein
MIEDDPEIMLPEAIRLRSVKSGKEWGWRRNDIMAAIMAARSVGLANVGGQVQFLFPDGTCELYWMNYDATDRGANESWTDYVERSADEVAQSLRRILDTKDLIKEGRESFDFLQKKATVGVNLEDHLVFIAYFAKEQ